MNSSLFYVQRIQPLSVKTVKIQSEIKFVVLPQYYLPEKEITSCFDFILRLAMT